MSNLNTEILGAKNFYSRTLKAIDAKIKFQQDEEEYLDNFRKEYFQKKKEKQSFNNRFLNSRSSDSFSFSLWEFNIYCINGKEISLL